MLEQDFMKEVLKRFDKIDNKLDEHSRILNEHSKTLNEHSKILEEHSKILNEHSTTINLLKETVHENTKCIVESTKRISENSEKIDELAEYYKAHNRTLIRFETELDQKIGALFDSYIANHDEHKIFYSGINDLNQQIFEHGIRISALEDLHKQKLA